MKTCPARSQAEESSATALRIAQLSAAVRVPYREQTSGHCIGAPTVTAVASSSSCWIIKLLVRFEEFTAVTMNNGTLRSVHRLLVNGNVVPD
jgi:hypothetical protein